MLGGIIARLSVRDLQPLSSNWYRSATPQWLSSGYPLPAYPRNLFRLPANLIGLGNLGGMWLGNMIFHVILAVCSRHTQNSDVC